jgi:mannosyltransferase
MKGGAVSRVRGRHHWVVAEVGLVLLVTMVGAWLRFQGLGRDSFWFDEAMSASWAPLPPRELLQEIAKDVHPPLYYLLVHAVVGLGESETVLRAPSALFGTLSIPLLYVVGRAWFSGLVGLLAAFLLAISPVHLWHSQDARMYTLLTLEGLLSWYLLSQLLESQRRWRWIGYVLISEAILYTHYYGALLILPQTGLVALLRRRGEVERSFWSQWLAVQAGLVILFLPWVVFAGASIQPGKLRWIAQGPHPIIRFAEALVGFAGGAQGESVWFRGLHGFPILLLAMASLVLDQDRKWRPPWAAVHERPTLLCLSYFAVPIAAMLAISLIHPLLVPRYLLMCTPAFWLLVSSGLLRVLPDRALIAGTAVLVLLALPGLMHYLSVPRTPDYRGVATLINAQALPGDLVLFAPGDRRTFEYYLRGGEVRLGWCGDVLGDSTSEAIKNCLKGPGRVWVVSAYSLVQSRRPTSQALSVEQFDKIQTSEFFRVRVVLYGRRHD